MLDAPQRIGRYEIRGTLGQGAMGVVYRGWDTRLELEVAIKLLLTGGDAAANSEEIQRLVREVKISRVLKHPNIVSVYDVDDDPATGHTFIVMEFINGVSLGGLLKQRQLSFQQTLELVGHLANALDYAAQAGVVHRDIKPANILVETETLMPKLVDFGIARLQGTNLTQAQALLGTPHYMSPEQWRGETADGRSDLFSLGAVLYELLTGQKAFPGDSLPAIMQTVLDPTTPAPPAEVRPGVIPEALNSAVMKALAKNPVDRYQRGVEMQKALHRALEQPAAAPRPAPPPAARPSPSVQPAPRRTALSTGGLKLVDEPPPPVPEPEEEEAASLAKTQVTRRFRSMVSAALKLGIGAVVLLALAWIGWPVINAKFAPALTANLSILRPDEHSRLTLLGDGAPLLPGEHFAVYLKPSRDSFVYVVRVSPSGQILKLFPNPELASQRNPIRSTQELWLPAPNHQRAWFSASEIRGQEEIVIVMTAEPLQRLDDPLGLLAAAGMRTAQTEDTMLTDLLRIQAKLVTGQEQGTSVAPSSSVLPPTRLVQGNGLGFSYRFRLRRP